MSTTGVVLLNFGDHDDTLACLASLERSHDLDLDVVVVDNGPADADHDRLRRAVGRRGETVATGDNLGYAAGNNVGIRRVLDRGCERVWILNPDTLVEPTTLPRLHRALDDVPDCGIVGPRMFYVHEPRKIWFDGGTVDPETGSTGHLNMGATARGLPLDTADVDYVTGASMLVRSAMIEDIGLIPTRYFLYHEEVDWCVRAQRAGWRTLVHRRARMTHHKRSSGALPTTHYLYYMTRNRYLFAQDCLGIDGDAALVELERGFLASWRGKVELLAPDWIPTFEAIVALATSDARAGVEGRSEQAALFPPPLARRTA